MGRGPPRLLRAASESPRLEKQPFPLPGIFVEHLQLPPADAASAPHPSLVVVPRHVTRSASCHASFRQEFRGVAMPSTLMFDFPTAKETLWLLGANKPREVEQPILAYSPSHIYHYRLLVLVSQPLLEGIDRPRAPAGRRCAGPALFDGTRRVGWDGGFGGSAVAAGGRRTDRGLRRRGGFGGNPGVWKRSRSTEEDSFRAGEHERERSVNEGVGGKWTDDAHSAP